jgi:hypothetical protein
MEEMLSEYASSCEGDVWQRNVTIKMNDRSYNGKIDSINNNGVLISIHQSLQQQNGKIIRLLMKHRNLKTVKTAIIEWSDEWGFGARFI